MGKPDQDGAHDQLDDDFTSVLDQKAMRLHEIFLSLRRAGFPKGTAENMVAELVSETFSSVDD